jgi:hypothetical protein
VCPRQPPLGLFSLAFGSEKGQFSFSRQFSTLQRLESADNREDYMFFSCEDSVCFGTEYIYIFSSLRIYIHIYIYIFIYMYF